MGDIKKLSQSEMDDFFEVGIQNHATDGDVGYWLHLDSCDVSPDVARITDEFPLYLAHMTITEDDVSPYSKRLLEAEGRKREKKSLTRGQS